VYPLSTAKTIGTGKIPFQDTHFDACRHTICCLLVALTQQIVDDDEDEYGTQTTTAQFLGTIAGNQSTNKFIHAIKILKILLI
jgi:hypothetical protein